MRVSSVQNNYSTQKTSFGVRTPELVERPKVTPQMIAALQLYREAMEAKSMAEKAKIVAGAKFVTDAPGMNEYAASIAEEMDSRAAELTSQALKALKS